MTPRWILVAGWLVFVVFAYPGYLTTESLDQLMDARVGVYSDWYTPAMSALWRLIGNVIAGPFGMLAVQSLLFLAGGYGLLRRAMSDRSAALAAASVLLFPPVGSVLAVVWRDGQLAGFMLAGAAALASERRGVRVGGLGLLLVGATMRDGAMVAGLPLVVGLFAWPGLIGWRRLAVAAALWAAVATSAVVADHALVDNRTDRPSLALARLDIIGVARFAPMTEPELRSAGLGDRHPDEARRSVRVLYRYPDRYAELMPLPALDDHAGRAMLRRARAELAWTYPRAYLRHRGHLLWRSLGANPGPAWRPIYTSFTETPEQRLVAHHRARHSAAQELLIDAAVATPVWMFRPLVYAVLAGLLLTLAIVRRRRDALALLVSGLAYQGSLLVTVVIPEYRHAHWLVVCTVLAAILLAAGELGALVARRQTSPSTP